MKKATLQDVAALAGLSTGTVSKYINGKPVSPKNQEKIRAAINTLEFTPSPLARSFASGKSYMILLYLVVEEPIVDSTWQHELPIIHGITDMLRGSKYSLKIEIASVQEEEENVHKLDAYCRSQYVDGIILLSPWEVNIKLVLSLDYHDFPYVIIGGNSSGSDHACIDFDNEKPVYDRANRIPSHDSIRQPPPTLRRRRSLILILSIADQTCSLCTPLYTLTMKS